MHIGRIEIDFMRHIWLCAPKQALLNVANNVEKIVELVKEENLFIVLFLLQICGVPRVMCLVLYQKEHGGQGDTVQINAGLILRLIVN